MQIPDPEWSRELTAVRDSEARKAVQKFWDHWLKLPRPPGQIAPHLRAFLDAPEPALQPRVALLDIVPPDKIIVRLHSSARENSLGQAITGTNVLDICLAEDRDRLWKAAHEVVTRPCGWMTESVVTGASGVAARYLAINLPLMHDGGTLVMANYSVALENGETAGERGSVAGVGPGQWVDLGAGTPKF
ncbi:MAG: hypothetical protein KDE14_06400 [Rhodobacteraceae bacterium]|nr:hypothetical protein [Paracoccaceae bacterium]